MKSYVPGDRTLRHPTGNSNDADDGRPDAHARDAEPSSGTDGTPGAAITLSGRWTAATTAAMSSGWRCPGQEPSGLASSYAQPPDRIVHPLGVVERTEERVGTRVHEERDVAPRRELADRADLPRQHVRLLHLVLDVHADGAGVDQRVDALAHRRRRVAVARDEVDGHRDVDHADDLAYGAEQSRSIHVLAVGVAERPGEPRARRADGAAPANSKMRADAASQALAITRMGRS